MAAKGRSGIKGAFISIEDAMNKAGIADKVILALDASWHREMRDNKEVVKFADFNFLVADDDGVKEVNLSIEDGDVKLLDEKASEDVELSKEDITELKRFKLPPLDAVLEEVEKDPKVQKAKRKAKHLRLYQATFLLFDDEFSKPTWRLLLKNWPLTNYFKREKPLTAEVIVDASTGKVIKSIVYEG